MIGLFEVINNVLDMEVETKLKNDKDICKALLYSHYYIFRDFPEVLGYDELNLKWLKAAIYNNMLSVNYGYDPLMLFYFMNRKDLENTDFGTFYKMYLQLLKNEKKEIGEYASINVYHTLVLKIDKYKEMGGVFDE